MKMPSIPQDDLLDVVEMTHKIENYISVVCDDQSCELAISSIISASINCILNQCDTLQEVIFYRNIFVELLDSTISSIRKGKRRK